MFIRRSTTMEKQVQLLLPLKGVDDEILLPQEGKKEIVAAMAMLLRQIVAEETQEDKDDSRS
jgi:hypothetical protein